MITGHARKDGTLSIDFESLVKLNGTLVFLMSISSMEMILDGLMNAGMPSEMPAAVLERGTTARQRRVTATVGTLKEEADRAGIRTPAIILVGKVCALSEQLHWAEDRPLGGRQFLLTRPRQNMSVLAGRLRDLGAQVIEMPAIRTEMITPNEPLRKALVRFAEMKQQRWLVFTSPIGVSVFFDLIREMRMDLRDIFGQNRVKIGAIGSATGAVLEKHGLFPDAVPDVYSAGQLGEKLAETAEAGDHILIVRAEKGSEELIPPLTEAGLEVEDIPLYRTIYEMDPLLRDETVELFRNGEIDAVTFTSGSTVRGFVAAMYAGDEKPGLDFSRIRAVCIGEQTARAAAEYGMQIKTSRQASMDAMVEKILELYGRG